VVEWLPRCLVGGELEVVVAKMTIRGELLAEIRSGELAAANDQESLTKQSFAGTVSCAVRDLLGVDSRSNNRTSGGRPPLNNRIHEFPTQPMNVVRLETLHVKVVEAK
jgi:hypothetical protein